MHYIYYRNEDGNWYWLGDNCWAPSRHPCSWGPSVRYFNTRTYAEKLAGQIEIAMANYEGFRSNVKVGTVK